MYQPVSFVGEHLLLKGNITVANVAWFLIVVLSVKRFIGREDTSIRVVTVTYKLVLMRSTTRYSIIGTGDFVSTVLTTKRKKRCTTPRIFVMDVVMHSSVESTKLFIVCVRSAVSETIRLEMILQNYSLRLELQNSNQYRYYDYKLVTYLQ